MEDNSNKTTGIIVTILIVLLIGGGIFWFLNRDDNESDSAMDGTSQSQQETEPASEESGTIVVVAQQTPDLSTLVSAVQAADLVETLQAAGPYTVFAPTNEAFQELPDGTLANLLKPENKEQLKSILTYHVVAGEVMASDLSDGQVITTVQGGTLTVSIKEGKVYLIDAKGNQVMVEMADVNADNGVVHVIDGVLMP